MLETAFKAFKGPKRLQPFISFFYSYLWAGNKLGLNLVIFFSIELVSFLLISCTIVHVILSSINHIQSLNFSSSRLFHLLLALVTSQEPVGWRNAIKMFVDTHCCVHRKLLLEDINLHWKVSKLISTEEA